MVFPSFSWFFLVFPGFSHGFSWFSGPPTAIFSTGFSTERISVALAHCGARMSQSCRKSPGGKIQERCLPGLVTGEQNELPCQLTMRNKPAELYNQGYHASYESYLIVNLDWVVYLNKLQSMGTLYIMYIFK